jgi:hypothetical protein
MRNRQAEPAQLCAANGVIAFSSPGRGKKVTSAASEEDAEVLVEQDVGVEHVSPSMRRQGFGLFVG